MQPRVAVRSAGRRLPGAADRPDARLLPAQADDPRPQPRRAGPRAAAPQDAPDDREDLRRHRAAARVQYRGRRRHGTDQRDRPHPPDPRAAAGRLLRRQGDRGHHQRHRPRSRPVRRRPAAPGDPRLGAGIGPADPRRVHRHLRRPGPGRLQGRRGRRRRPRVHASIGATAGSLPATAHPRGRAACRPPRARRRRPPRRRRPGRAAGWR